jgi:hypothetical protein
MFEWPKVFEAFDRPRALFRKQNAARPACAGLTFLMSTQYIVLLLSFSCGEVDFRPGGNWLTRSCEKCLSTYDACQISTRAGSVLMGVLMKSSKRLYAKLGAVVGIAVGVVVLIAIVAVYLRYPVAISDQRAALRGSLKLIAGLGLILVGTGSATLSYLASERRNSN